MSRSGPSDVTRREKAAECRVIDVISMIAPPGAPHAGAHPGPGPGLRMPALTETRDRAPHASRVDEAPQPRHAPAPVDARLPLHPGPMQPPVDIPGQLPRDPRHGLELL